MLKTKILENGMVAGHLELNDKLLTMLCKKELSDKIVNVDRNEPQAWELKEMLYVRTSY